MRSFVAQAFARFGLVVCLIGTQICAQKDQRDQNEYMQLVIDYYRGHVPNEAMEWLADSLEHQPYNAMDVIEKLGEQMKLTAQQEPDESSGQNLKTLYDWSVELFENLADASRLAKSSSAKENNQICHPFNYKYLLSSINWINSMNQLHGSQPIKPSEKHSKFFNFVEELTKKIMSICVHNIALAHENYLDNNRSWWEEEIDEYFDIYAESDDEDTASPESPDMNEKRLYRKALKVDAFDTNFLASLIDEVYEYQQKNNHLADFKQQWMDETRGKLIKSCQKLSEQLVLSVGIYDLATGTNPELTRPINDLTDDWSFRKLREYNRLCNRLLVDHFNNE